MSVKWFVREKGSEEWHGGWDTRFDAVRGIAMVAGCDPLPRAVVEAHYEFTALAVEDEQ